MATLITKKVVKQVTMYKVPHTYITTEAMTTAHHFICCIIWCDVVSIWSQLPTVFVLGWWKWVFYLGHCLFGSSPSMAALDLVYERLCNYNMPSASSLHWSSTSVVCMHYSAHETCMSTLKSICRMYTCMHTLKHTSAWSSHSSEFACLIWLWHPMLQHFLSNYGSNFLHSQTTLLTPGMSFLCGTVY